MVSSHFKVGGLPWVSFVWDYPFRASCFTLHQRTPISSSDLSLQENNQLIIAVGTGFVQLEKLDRAFKLVDLFRHRTLIFCGTGNLCIYVSHRLATSRLNGLNGRLDFSCRQGDGADPARFCGLFAIYLLHLFPRLRLFAGGPRRYRPFRANFCPPNQ